jgi:hypothetical protein
MVNVGGRMAVTVDRVTMPCRRKVCNLISAISKDVSVRKRGENWIQAGF